MHNKNDKTPKLAAILLALLPVWFGNVAHAAVILEVNISDPSSVVFAPTAAFAEIMSLDTTTSYNGITLVDFFSGNGVTTDEVHDIQFDSGAIDVFDSTAGVSRSPLEFIFIGVFDGGWTPNDINFYDCAGESCADESFTVSFLSTETALAGLASHDLSSFTGMPTPGSVGNLLVGEPELVSIIGQWQVVATTAPEPSTLALLGLGLLGIGSTRRRRLQ